MKRDILFNIIISLLIGLGLTSTEALIGKIIGITPYIFTIIVLIITQSIIIYKIISLINIKKKHAILISGILLSSGLGLIPSANEPSITDITIINVTSSYDGTQYGFHMGSSAIYDNGLSLQHPGKHYEDDPNWFLWVNETNGTGGQINLGGTSTNNHAGGSVTMLDNGTIIFTRGGYFNYIPADLWVSNNPYDIHNWTQKLSDYITASGGCSLSSAVTQNNTFLVAYRNGPNDISSTGQQLLAYNTSTWTKYKDLEIAHGETWEGHALCPCYNWMRFDPRYNYTFITWSWKEEAGTYDNWGSAPFIYSDDNGATWKRANGTTYTLPIRYSDISGWQSKADIPDDSIANNLYPYNHGAESGVTPDGHFYMVVTHQDVRDGPRYGYFWLWNGTAWVSHNLSGLTYSDAFSCGVTKDYIVYVFADTDNNATLKARISADNGETWSAPIEIVHESGDVFINGVSYCQPIKGYTDNYARFFYSFYNWSSGTSKQCKVKWVKFQITNTSGYPSINETALSNSLTDGRITWSGYPGETVWCNSSGDGYETLNLTIIDGSGGDDTDVTEIRVYLDNLNDSGIVINADNIHLYASVDNATFHDFGAFPTNGGNITLNATTWTWADDPFPITGNDTIYMRFQLSIPSSQTPDIYYSATATRWKIYILG